MVVCLDRPGAVRVTKVQALGGDLEVTGFALRPNPAGTGASMLGSSVDTFVSEGLDPGAATVTAVCGSAPAAGDELIVRLHSDGTATTKAEGLSVTYVSDGTSGQLAIPVGLVMCIKPPEDPECTVQPPSGSS